MGVGCVCHQPVAMVVWAGLDRNDHWSTGELIDAASLTDHM